jgi:hypothetical protein
MKQTLFFALAISLLFSCKKETIEVRYIPENICLVDSVYTDNGYQAFFYNSNNKLEKAISKDGDQTFVQNIVYAGNLVTISVEGQDGQQSVWLNSFGYCDSILSEFAGGEIIFRFKYNAKQQVIERHIYGDLGTFVLDQKNYFEYINGNNSREYTINDGDTSFTDYVYDLTKENSLQRHETLLQFLPANNNILTKIIYPDGTEDALTYVYDASNKVTKRTIEEEDGTLTTEQFIWICK